MGKTFQEYQRLASKEIQKNLAPRLTMTLRRIAELDVDTYDPYSIRINGKIPLLNGFIRVNFPSTFDVEKGIVEVYVEGDVQEYDFRGRPVERPHIFKPTNKRIPVEDFSDQDLEDALIHKVQEAVAYLKETHPNDQDIKRFKLASHRRHL